MNLVGIMRALRTAIMLPAFAICTVALMPAAARAQNFEWRGIVDTYGYTEDCAAVGLAADMRERWTARLVPSGLGSNGDMTSLSIFGAGYAVAFRINGRFSTSPRTAEVGQLGRFVSVWPHETQILVSSQTPRNARWTATTSYIFMVGEIRGYLAEGCNASFEGTVILRP